MSEERITVRKSVAALEEWFGRTAYKAYDPFDGLSSWLRVLTFRNAFAQRALQQFVRRNPLNFRPYIGIKPHTSTKGMGFLAGGYLNLCCLEKDDNYQSKAESCLDWLTRNASSGYSGACWGNSFDYISRGFYLPKGAPTLVWTSLIGHQFIRAFRVTKNGAYLDVAREAGHFILRDLPRIPCTQGVCISYVCGESTAVHNANLLGAGFLAELYKETHDQEYLSLATDAVRYSAGAQLPNGAWYYGEEEKFHWIDNWHTAYNLDSLLRYQQNSGSIEFESQMLKGLDFYVEHFFRVDGAPKYYWDREYKIDIQSCSQSIDTLVLFGSQLSRPDLLEMAWKTALWTIRNMQDSTGFFYLWKNRLFTNRTPTFHWGGTTMFHALTHLLLASREHED